ncbi:NACHT domain-containing protein [Streptomyces sp. NPDC002308]
MAIFLLQELAAGLLPDIYKGFAGDSRKAAVIGAVVAFVLVGLLLIIVHLRGQIPDEEPVMSPESRARVRAALLGSVRRVWMSGLDRSWEGTVRVELGLTEQRAAVHDPWGPPVLTSGTTDDGAPLAAGTRLVDVFARHDGQLLILGAPGAGKTTHMLELTAALVEAADRDEAQPAPVFLLLTNWNGEPFEEWILGELRERYRIPVTTGAALLAQDEIALVLDGLDEVAPDRRASCLAGINAFLAADHHPHCRIAVSCRAADYAALGRRLAVNGAVVVQPLPVPAVHALLNGAGERLRGLAAAAAADPELARLLTTPLMMGVAALAYEGAEEGEVGAAGDVAERRGRIFDAYIDRMLRRDRTLRAGEMAPTMPTDRAKGQLFLIATMLDTAHVTVYYPMDPIRVILQAPAEVTERVMSRWLRPAMAAMRVLSGYEAGNPESRSNAFYRVVMSVVVLMAPGGAIPQPDFLEYGTDRAILRRVGDGYAFLHKTIQDHLAAGSGRVTPQEREASDSVS